MNRCGRRFAAHTEQIPALQPHLPAWFIDEGIRQMLAFRVALPDGRIVCSLSTLTVGLRKCTGL